MEPAGPRTKPRVTQDSWSSPQAHGFELESPGTAGRHREPSDPGPSRLGPLVEPMGLRIRAQVTWDSWLTPQALGQGPELPQRAVPPRGPSDPSAIHP